MLYSNSSFNTLMESKRILKKKKIRSKLNHVERDNI